MKKKVFAGKVAAILTLVILTGTLSPLGVAAQTADEAASGDTFLEDVKEEADVSEETAGEEEGAVAAEADVDSRRGKDKVVGNGYWHFDESSGVLSYDKEKSGAIDDFEEFKSDKGSLIKKVIVRSGPTKISEDDTCDSLSNLEEVVYEAPVTLTNMCFIVEKMYKNCPSLRKLTIGKMKSGNLQEIDKEAFMNCTSLNEVSLDKGVWHMGRRTFANCVSLTSFTFPDDIANIRGDTFWACPNLKELRLADSNNWMREVQNTIYEINDPHKDERSKAFMTPCLMMVPEGVVKEQGGKYTVIKGTKDIQWGCFQSDLSLKSVVVASTVKSIQSEAFCGCDNLESIYLPRSLVRLGNYAFSGYEKKADVPPLNQSLKDIYYEGTEEEWKKVKLAYYSIDKGKINLMSIKSTTTLYDHLIDAGVPSGVKVHFETPIVDTEKDLKTLIKGNPGGDDASFPVETSTINYNGAGTEQLKNLGVSMNLTYASTLTFCGRKHVRSTAKASAKAINDLKVEGAFYDLKTGNTRTDLEISKVIIKNAKNAATPTDAKPPYFNFQLKAASPKSMSKEDKLQLKALNKILKKDPNARVYFTIDPYDISSFTSDNYKGLKVISDTEAKINKIGFSYEYQDKGEKYTEWILLKQCKNNDKNNKGDYTLAVDGNNVTVTGYRNYMGSVTFTK